MSSLLITREALDDLQDLTYSVASSFEVFAALGQLGSADLKEVATATGMNYVEAAIDLDDLVRTGAVVASGPILPRYTINRDRVASISAAWTALAGGRIETPPQPTGPTVELRPDTERPRFLIGYGLDGFVITDGDTGESIPVPVDSIATALRWARLLNTNVPGAMSRADAELLTLAESHLQSTPTLTEATR